MNTSECYKTEVLNFFFTVIFECTPILCSSQLSDFILKYALFLLDEAPGTCALIVHCIAFTKTLAALQRRVLSPVTWRWEGMLSPHKAGSDLVGAALERSMPLLWSEQ